MSDSVPASGRPSAEAASLLERARQLASHGALEAAEAAYADLLAMSPGEPEALNFLAMTAIARQRLGAGLELLKRCIEHNPQHPVTLKNLGVCFGLMGRFEDALRALDEAIEVEPDFYVAQLYRGTMLEKLGHVRAGLAAYLQAVTRARSEGLWSDDSNTPPGLRGAVQHALRQLNLGRRQLLDTVMAPLLQKHGQQDLARVVRALAGFLGDLRLVPPDSAQKPTFLYFPDLPTAAYFERSLFPWYPALEAQTAEIRDELLAVLGDDQVFEPFLGKPPPGMTSQYLGGGIDGKPQWNAYFFYRHGRRFEDNCRRCPATAAALDAAPIVHIREHAPENLFSVLGPRSEILPHHGVTNTRVVTHLPLLVPDNCAIRVGGIDHAWREGHCITFDDTFEHSAWNRSDRTRVILLFDTWNPHLTALECEAIGGVVAAIGDLNREAGVH